MHTKHPSGWKIALTFSEMKIQSLNWLVFDNYLTNGTGSGEWGAPLAGMGTEQQSELDHVFDNVKLKNSIKDYHSPNIPLTFHYHSPIIPHNSSNISKFP